VADITTVAEACFLGGYIDSWGSGIMKIVNACKSAGFPVPVLEEDGGGFIVKLFKDRCAEEELQKSGLNDRQIKAVLYVKEKGRITNKEYQEINEVSRRWTTVELTNLVNKNIFKNTGYGAGSYYELIAN
jgi:ATP-dependent DNA helicase RecG